MENASKQLTTSSLIDAYHNEPVLWDTSRNANEEKNELAWSRLAGMLNTHIGKFLADAVRKALGLPTSEELRPVREYVPKNHGLMYYNFGRLLLEKVPLLMLSAASSAVTRDSHSATSDSAASTSESRKSLEGKSMP